MATLEDISKQFGGELPSESALAPMNDIQGIAQRFGGSQAVQPPQGGNDFYSIISDPNFDKTVKQQGGGGFIDALKGLTTDIYGGITNALGLNAMNPNATESSSKDIFGVGSLAQTPARAVLSGTQVEAAKGIDQARGNLAQTTAQLIKALRGINDPSRRNVIEEQIQENMTLMQNFNDQAREISGQELTYGNVAGSAGKAALTVLLSGGAPILTGGRTIVGEGAAQFLKSAAVKAGQGALIGSGIGASQALSENQGIGGVATGALSGAGYGALLGGALSLGKLALVKALPKLLQYTSNVPDILLQEEIKNPAAVGEARTILKTQGEAGEIDVNRKLGETTGVLGKFQEAVQAQRALLTKEYNEGSAALSQTYGATPFDLSSVFPTKVIMNLANEGFENSPLKPSSMTVEEILNFNKELNGRLSGAAAYSPETASLRAFRSLWQTALEKVGDLGNGINPLQEFLKNYGAKANVISAFNQLIPSLGRKATIMPKGQQTALNMLNNAATANKAAYLNTLQDFERMSGFPVKAYMEALQTNQIRPDFPWRAGSIGRILKTFVSPFLGPGAAPKIIRAGNALTSAEVNPALGGLAKEAFMGGPGGIGRPGAVLGAGALGLGAALQGPLNVAENAGNIIGNLAQSPQQNQ